MGTILVGILLAGVIAAACVSIVRRKKRGNSCGCGCAGCTGCRKK